MKKFRPIVLLGIVLVILFAFSVNAQSVNFNNALKPFWDLIKYLFVTLPASPTFKYAYFKFVIFLVLGALLLILVRHAPFLKDADDTAKKRGDLLAWFIALAAVISIPQKALEFLFKEFGMWGTIALGVALPVLTFINFANNDGKARGWGMMIAGGLLFFLGMGFGGDWPGRTWLMIAGIISVLIGFFIMMGTTQWGWFPTAGAGGGDHPPGGGGAVPPGGGGAVPPGGGGAVPPGGGGPAPAAPHGGGPAAGAPHGSGGPAAGAGQNSGGAPHASGSPHSGGTPHPTPTNVPMPPGLEEALDSLPEEAWPAVAAWASQRLNQLRNS